MSVITPALISGAISLGSQLVGGLFSRKRRNEARRELETQRARNDAWYMRRANERATDRADAQDLLSHVRDSVRQRNRQAVGRGVVLGSTGVEEARARIANNEAIGNAVSRISANEVARKDALRNRYESGDNKFSGEVRDGLYDAGRQSALAGDAAGKALSDVASAFVSSGGKGKGGGW